MKTNKIKIVTLIFLIAFAFSNTAFAAKKKRRKKVKTPKTTAVLKKEKEKEEKVVERKTAPDDMEKIIKRGKLVVGMYYNDMPPFFMKNSDGVLYGVDIAIAKGVADQLGVKLEIVRKAKTYQELYEQLVGGEVDLVISKFSRTFERAKRIRYTTPYVNFRQALLVNRVAAVQRDIEKYPMDYLRDAKFKIGVKAKTSYVEYARLMFKNAEIVEFKEWSEVVKSVSKGEILAAFYDENEIMKLIRKNPDIALYTFAFVLKDKKDPIAIGVPFESTHFLSWLNIFLETNDIKKSVNSLIEEYPEVYDSEKNSN